MMMKFGRENEGHEFSKSLDFQHKIWYLIRVILHIYITFHLTALKLRQHTPERKWNRQKQCKQCRYYGVVYGSRQLFLCFLAFFAVFSRGRIFIGFFKADPDPPEKYENSHSLKIPETFHGNFPKFTETFQLSATLHVPPLQCPADPPHPVYP